MIIEISPEWIYCLLIVSGVYFLFTKVNLLTSWFIKCQNEKIQRQRFWDKTCKKVFEFTGHVILDVFKSWKKTHLKRKPFSPLLPPPYYSPMMNFYQRPVSPIHPAFPKKHDSFMNVNDPPKFARFEKSVPKRTHPVEHPHRTFKHQPTNIPFDTCAEDNVSPTYAEFDPNPTCVPTCIPTLAEDNTKPTDLNNDHLPNGLFPLEESEKQEDGLKNQTPQDHTQKKKW